VNRCSFEPFSLPSTFTNNFIFTSLTKFFGSNAIVFNRFATTIRMEFHPHVATRLFDASFDQSRVHLIFLDTAPVEYLSYYDGELGGCFVPPNVLKALLLIARPLFHKIL